MLKHKAQQKKSKSEVVTGDFELHFEEVVNRNRFIVLILVTGSLILLAMLVPGLAYYSQAGVDNALLEAEGGKVINSENIILSNPEAIEFRVKRIGN